MKFTMLAGLVSMTLAAQSPVCKNIAATYNGVNLMCANGDTNGISVSGVNNKYTCKCSDGSDCMPCVKGPPEQIGGEKSGSSALSVSAGAVAGILLAL